MAPIDPRRMTARISGDFVVFLLGMRINAWWRPDLWMPALSAMPRMLHELDHAPRAQTGFLGHNGISMRCTVQYWRSFDALEAYARAPDHAHFPAWTDFNRRLRSSRGAVGIWHETYLVPAGGFEAIYSGMPPHGLARAAEGVPIVTRHAARDRVQANDV